MRLDLAGGSGDIAFAALEKGAGRVILSDINPAMLDVAQSRALQRGLAANLSFLFTEVPFLERFAEAARAGFSAVEFAFGYEYTMPEIAARLSANGGGNQVIGEHCTPRL